MHDNSAVTAGKYFLKFYMKKLSALVLLSFLLGSCNFKSEKFITANKYTGNAKLKNVYVIVADDTDTKEWLNSYKNAFIDSLKTYHVNVEGMSYCCSDKKAAMKDVMKASLASSPQFENVLTIAITKTNAGNRSSITREMQINLYNLIKGKKIWNGTVVITFDWYISGAQLKDVAQKLTNTTLDKMKGKDIL